MLAATLTTAVVFFPVTLLFGVSKFLFYGAGRRRGHLSVRFVLRRAHRCPAVLRAVREVRRQSRKRFDALDTTELGPIGSTRWFTSSFDALLKYYDSTVEKVLRAPRKTLAVFAIVFVFSFALVPFMGFSFFPQTDAGQFVITFKAPSGTKLDATEQEAAKLEDLVRDTVSKDDLGLMVANLGVDPGFSALFSPNSAMHTGVLQVSLNPHHALSSEAYIDRVKRRMTEQMPELSAFFSSGSLVDSVLNAGSPAPINVQVNGNDLQSDYKIAQDLAEQFQDIKGVADVYVPQDLDYPSLTIEYRSRTGE